MHAELQRTANLLERQYYKRVSFHPLLPLCPVLREGTHADARTLRAQAEMFAKAELFKFCQLLNTDRLEEAFERADHVAFAVEDGATRMNPDVRALFEPQGRPRILLVADADMADLYREYIADVDWRAAYSAEDALQVLANEDIDMVLLDIWLGHWLVTRTKTVMHFDDVPMASEGLEQGQELVARVRERQAL